jgi:hypothetical protein
MPRVSLGTKVWYEVIVPIFLERFLLYLCAAAFLALVLVNGMGLNIHQRIGLGVTLVGAAYFLAHTVERIKDQAPANPLAAKAPVKPPILPTEGYSTNITLHGPDGVEFLIYPSGNQCLCKLLNGTLSIIPKIQVNFTSIRSFDSARLMWSDPLPFSGLMGPTRTPTNPRNFTQEFDFVVPHQNGIRLGDFSNSVASWPNGDSSPMQRWRVGMKVVGLPAAWTIDLCIRWTSSTGVFEFREYNDAIPPASF